MLDLVFFYIEKSVGIKASLILKILTWIVLMNITFQLRKRYKKLPIDNRHKIMRMFFMYSFYPLISSFNHLLNWSNFPNPESYFGYFVALIFMAIGNAYMLWFTLNFLLKKMASRKIRIIISISTFLSLTSIIIPIIDRFLSKNHGFAWITIIHWLISGGIYLLVFLKSRLLMNKNIDQKLKNRIRYFMMWSLMSIFTILSISIDSLFKEYTILIYSSWIGYLLTVIFMYWAFIGDSIFERLKYMGKIFKRNGKIKRKIKEFKLFEADGAYQR